MSKLSFRARALDASKPMPIYLAEELPDLPDYSAINRAVPQMPSGMEKEEECEHHLQRAICTGLIIPTPEVFPVTDLEFYEKCYPPDYKMPKQHIHMQPLWQEQETPEYDMDSDDERWLRQQRHPELTELKFEQMMDKLEKSSGQTVATLSEAKLLLERQDDLVIAVYDYWLNKRLKTQHPLILSVRTESRIGQSTNNPYLAFRRRTEKMQTRKNRKNDESSYEKMLKLRRDLARAASLLDMVARRERAKRDLMRLTALIAERRFNAADFAGQLLAEIAHAQPQYTAVSLGVNTVTAAAGYRRDPYAAPHYPPRAPAPAPLGVDQPRQREKRPHKRRPRRPHGAAVGHPLRDSGVCTSSEEEYVVASGVGAGGARPLDASPAPAAPPDDGPFAFTRKPGCYYELPTATLYGDPVDPDDATKDSLYQHDLDYKQRYTLTSLSEPYSRCVGFARRRMGRGGRVLLDRVPTPLDDLWPHLPFTFNKSSRHRACKEEEVDMEMEAHRHPKQLVRDYHTSGKHPWRHAFRRHLAKNSHLWLRDEDPAVDVKKLEEETMDVDEDVVSDMKRECETANGLSDISVSDDRTMLDQRATRALRDHIRKRSWSACSDSSYDSDSSLLPVEENFRQFFEEVNSKWLHFRPKTPPAESPRPTSPSLGDDLVAVGADTPLAVELYAWGQDEPLSAAELTLRELHELQASDVDTSGGALDAAPDDLLSENFTGLTDAQLESILAETVADDARRGDDILEELVREVALDPKEHFLSRGQSAASGRAASGLVPPTPAAPATQSSPQPRRRASFGSSVVGVSALTADELPLLLATPHSPDPPPAPEPTPASTSAATTASTAATTTQTTSSVSAASPIPMATSSPKPTASLVSTTPFMSKISSAPTATSAPSPVPAAKIIVEEVNEVLHGRPEARRPRHARDDVSLTEEVQVAHGVHLKTVHNKHSPLKKHIITSAPHRNANAVAQPAIVVSSASASAVSGGADTAHGQPAPQIVTVAVSENLKVRLQNHLLSAQQAAVGLVQNGPLTVSAAHGVSVSGAAVVSNAATAVSTGSVSTSSTRRVSGGAPVVHLAASALQQKQLQLTPPVVVGTQHTLQHVPSNKLKVVHANALTHTQRAQLLAQSRAAAGGLTHLPAVVSLATLAEGKPGPAPATPSAPALQLKAAPGSVAQFFEIKGGPLAKGHQLVNVVRQPHPAKATVARFDLNDPKKRGTHLLATFDGTLKSNLSATTAVAGAPRPHRLSLASLDGRHLVRTAIPGVRAPHLRHQIQFKNRTLQVARAEHATAGGAQAVSVAHSGVSGTSNASVGTVMSGQAGSITIATAGKSSALPSTVVANLLQKNVAHLQKGQKIAISGTMGAVGVQPLAANMQAIAFTAQQLKARQARLITQPRAPPQPEIIEASTSPAGSSSSNASIPADGGLEAVAVTESADAAATNGAVRRRPADTMPMEVT